MEPIDSLNPLSSPAYSSSSSIPSSPAFKSQYTVGRHHYGTYKVRKNAALLSDQERKDFLDAIIRLKSTYVQDSKYSLYDQFVILHYGAVSLADKTQWDEKDMKAFKENKCKVDPAHGNPAFLAWHRKLLFEFEKALQSVNPNVTLPYWDWTDRESSESKIFIDEFMGRNGGSDGLGGPLFNSIFIKENGFVINQDLHRPGKGYPSIGEYISRHLGPFEYLATQLSEFNEFKLSNTFGPKQVSVDKHCFAKSTQVETRGFRIGIETGNKAHNPTHNWYGYGNGPQVTSSLAKFIQGDFPNQDIYGQFSTMPNVACSNNDPIFWLHHSNVDRLWFEWQQSGHYGSMYFPEEGRDQYPIYDSNEKYTFPYGHNLNDNMWPWDNSESITVPWLQEGLPNSNHLFTPAKAILTTDLSYVYDSYNKLSEHHSVPIKAHLPLNYKGKQVFEFNITPIALTTYYFELVQYGGSKIEGIKIHTQYNADNISEWEFQDKGFDAKSELKVDEIKEAHSPDHIKRYSFTVKNGSFYVVVTGQGDADINSYYTIRLCKEIGPSKVFGKYMLSDILQFNQKDDYKITVDLISKTKGSKDLKFFYVDNVGRITLSVNGFDSLIQLVGPSTTNPDVNIIGLDEGCCKLESPLVNAIITPGFYLVIVHHCSFGNRIGIPGNLTLQFEEYVQVEDDKSNKGSKVNNVNTIIKKFDNKKQETKSCCMVKKQGSSSSTNIKIPTINENDTVRNQSIPSNGDILYKLVLNGDQTGTAKNLIKVSLDSSMMSSVSTTVYKVVRKQLPDIFGFNKDTLVIATGKKKTTSSFPLEVDVEYYLRLSFESAPHFMPNDSYSIKFKSF